MSKRRGDEPVRIISGSARGRTLLAPPGTATRPTQDYVRESLFNILLRDVPGARVLDLFAGSGALALESLSRGAASAVLVDHAAPAVQTIRRNIDQLGFAAQCTVLACEWRQALTRLAGQKPFDLVFLDPPYTLTDTGGICAALLSAGLLAPEALLVVEHRRGEVPQVQPPLLRGSTRNYGDTQITFVRKEEGFDAKGDFPGQL